MDETSVCFLFLFFIILWRTISVRIYNKVPEKVNTIFAWYILLFAGILGLFLRSLFDVVVFEYIKLHFLEDTKVNETLSLFLDPARDAAEIASLEIRPGLKFTSLISPLVSAFAVAIVTYQIFTFHSNVVPMHRRARTLRDMVFMTISMPAIFAVMALRANIRIWAVMSGSAWYGRERMCGGECTWDHVKNLEMATYYADLGIASAFQFYAVFLFGRLVAFLLQNSKFIVGDAGGNTNEIDAYKFRLSHAAVQGVYAYVMIGVIRSLAEVVAAVGSEFPKYSEQTANFQMVVLSKTEVVNGFVTLLGVLNMFVIGNLSDIKRVIGNANMKFNGTRLLLLVGQVQLSILTAFTNDSLSHTALLAFLAKHPDYLEFKLMKFVLWAFSFSSYQAGLLHSSLLAFECLAVALLNFYAWRIDEYARIMDEASGVNDNERNNQENNAVYRQLPP